jgi:hypothetical protein
LAGKVKVRKLNGRILRFVAKCLQNGDSLDKGSYEIDLEHYLAFLSFIVGDLRLAE